MLFLHLFSPFICFLSTSFISPLSRAICLDFFLLLFLSYLQSFLSFSLALSPSLLYSPFLPLTVPTSISPLHLSTQPYQYSQVSYTV